MPAEYRYNLEDLGNWILQQQAFPLIYLQIGPCRNISWPADNVALYDLAQCARPRYNSEDVFAVISILLQVSRFVALPYKISSVPCSHFTCPARPCLCKVAGDVQASCSTIYSLVIIKIHLPVALRYYKVWLPRIRIWNWALRKGNHALQGDKKNSIHWTRIRILKVRCRPCACVCHIASEELDQIPLQGRSCIDKTDSRQLSKYGSSCRTDGVLF